MNARLRSLCLAALLPLVVSQVASAQAPTPGEKWRTTMSMEMQGMKMPGMSTEVCIPKGRTPEPQQQEGCTVSNRKRVGSTESFDMVCTGKNAMTAHMEMTQESPTRWRGKMQSKTSEGEMTMAYSGEKQPGDCDASEMERKMNKMMADADAQRLKQCMMSAQSGDPSMFVVKDAQGCTDAASRKAFCEKARTSAGFGTVAGYQRMGRASGAGGNTMYANVVADSGKLCGFAPETVRTQLCSTAQGKKEWKFLSEDCPEISKPLAQRECAGRDFTTPVSPPYVEFCSAYAAAGRGVSMPSSASSGEDSGTAGGASSSGRASASTQGGSAGGNAPAGEEGSKPTDKAKEALNKGKQALKGLFGR